MEKDLVFDQKNLTSFLFSYQIQCFKWERSNSKAVDGAVYEVYINHLNNYCT